MLMRLLLVFLLLVLNITSQLEATPSRSEKLQPISKRVETAKEKENGWAEMVPKMDEVIVEELMGRRKLGSFQICALCTCCGGAKGYCLPSPCCYSINCNIPNRPFGFCAFTPKSCNCLGCHL